MKTNTKTLTPELLRQMDAYWRAANYLSVGQIYLYDNPLLQRPLTLADVKHMLLGHWGTTPGQNFIYVHLNRVIKKYDLDMIYVSGPGHGGPPSWATLISRALTARSIPISARMRPDFVGCLFNFRFPAEFPATHRRSAQAQSTRAASWAIRSAIHSGAVFDNPNLVVACVVGDGEAETGPLATAWHSNKFLNPITDGAVLPILHLNGYKISDPTVLAQIEREELRAISARLRLDGVFVEGLEPRSA